jgi:ribosomal protein S18 acetylase RimI-like enzyme
VIALIEGQIPDSQELVDLYASVGWIRYVQEPDELHEAVMRSTYVVVARRNDQLIGLARCLSDEVSIAYVQDILVRPEFQQQGVGRRLMEAVLNRFESARQIGLLTDDEDRQHSFYESMGFRDIGTFEEPALHAFVVLRP